MPPGLNVIFQRVSEVSNVRCKKARHIFAKFSPNCKIWLNRENRMALRYALSRTHLLEKHVNALYAFMKLRFYLAFALIAP